MNDPDDLYYCTYGELVEGQKYRSFSIGEWRTVGVCLPRHATAFVQAQRWVEPPPPPVMVEIEADALEAALQAWSAFGIDRDPAADDKMYRLHRATLWGAIREAREEARQ